MKSLWNRETKFALIVFTIIYTAEYIDHTDYRLQMASPPLSDSLCEKRPAYCWLKDKKSRE